MSKYYIHQPLLSAKVRTVVKDEKGQPVYLLVGRWGTRGDVISVYHLNGTVLASVKQTAFSVQTRFDLYEEHHKVGTLSRIFSIERDFYFIKKLNWLAIGDINNQTYRIYRFSKKVMEMQKVITISGDYCELSVTDSKDAPLCLCVASILDYWARKGKKEHDFFSEKVVNPELG
ncbi:MAG: LURP-one-related/scramblase family protein [Vagococcus sp.]